MYKRWMTQHSKLSSPDRPEPGAPPLGVDGAPLVVKGDAVKLCAGRSAEAGIQRELGIGIPITAAVSAGAVLDEDWALCPQGSLEQVSSAIPDVTSACFKPGVYGF